MSSGYPSKLWEEFSSYLSSDSPTAETSEKEQTLTACCSGEAGPKEAADAGDGDGKEQVIVGMKRPSSVLLGPEISQEQERAAPDNYKKGRLHAPEVMKCTNDVDRSNKDTTMLSKQATDGNVDAHCRQTNRRSAIAREALKKKIDTMVARIQVLEKENSRYRKEINETSKLFPAMLASNQTAENEKSPLHNRIGPMEQGNKQQPSIYDKSTKQQEGLIQNLREEIQKKDLALRLAQERMIQYQEENQKKDHLLERAQQRMKQLWKLLKNAVEENQKLKNANQHTNNLQHTAEQAQQNYLNLKLKFQKLYKDLKASEQRALKEKEVYAMDINDFIASAGDMTF